MAMVVAVAFSAAVGAIAGLFPEFKAAKFNPIQALQSEQLRFPTIRDCLLIRRIVLQGGGEFNAGKRSRLGLLRRRDRFKTGNRTARTGQLQGQQVCRSDCFLFGDKVRPFRAAIRCVLPKLERP
jgi:hypothetical protein